MKLRIATILALLFVVALPAQAQQDVTVREINAIRATALDSLTNMLGQLTEAEIIEAATPILAGERVRFTAYVMSDVRNSGLATYRPDNTPQIGRVHLYVRDTTANSLGKAGMDIQVVDGDFESTGILTTLPGDVVEVDAIVSPYFGEGGVSMQLSPISIVPTGETIADFGLTEEILAPVPVTSDEVNLNVGPGLQSINWANYERFNGQYVEFTNARVIRRDLGVDDERPDFDISTDGGTTVVPMYDTSLRFRNDRNGAYYSDFNVRANNDDYTPPPPGSVVNARGFLIFQGDDPFGTASVGEIQYLFIPMNDDDVTVLESPPQIAFPGGLSTVPGNAPVSIVATVAADPTRAVDNAVLKYYSSANADTMTVAPASVNGETYEFSVPAAEDGAFVTYWVEATDDTGATSETNDRFYRVLYDGIDDIADIQQTMGDVAGPSPFLGLTTDMNVEAVVMSMPDESGLVTLQDGTEPWSGVWVRSFGRGDLVNALSQGDIVRITRATIGEFRDNTQLDNLEYEITGSTTPYEPVTVTTDVLRDRAIAEAHEGILLRFENVTITSTNADAPSGPFGEFAFSNVGANMDELMSNALRADDESRAVSFELAASLEVGQELPFIQGVLSYSFGNSKIIPRTQMDLPTDVAVDVADEDETLPEVLTLSQNYPNPFNPITTIEYRMPATGDVRLAVFDLLGREVAVLVDGPVSAGVHTARFDATDLASGLYLYRIESAGQTIVRSMTLLK